MLNLNNISIILVRPQLGENIGAAARVMKNFSISDLRVVSPRDGWPNEKATAMSAGAKDLIENAQIFNSTEEAIADLNHLYATTARKRGMVKPIYFPETLAQQASEYNSSEKIGILFGQENNGLDNEDISLANGILTIPIGKDYSSLNLAQAICITSYELFKASEKLGKDLNLSEKEAVEESSNRKDVIELIRFLEEKMDEDNFYNIPEKREGMMTNVKNIFTRHNFTKQEISTLRGILNSKKN